MECIFLNLHYIQKNLQFWQSRAEVSNGFPESKTDFQSVNSFYYHLSHFRDQMLKKHTSWYVKEDQMHLSMA